MSITSFPCRLNRALAALFAIAALGAAPPAPAGSLRSEIAPERIWRALGDQLQRQSLAVAERDDARFELRLQTGRDEIRLAVDWDEAGGGSLVSWSAAAADGEERGRRLAEQVVADAAALRQENLYCRRGGAADLDEGFLDIAPDEAPDCGLGKFAAALFELEKCADHESALKILAACVRERNSLGMLRLALHFENGYAVPRRPERMTEYLRLAAEAGTPGYSAKARVQYATALYFGVGIAADRPAALAIFDELARRGDPDAAHFLAHGYHFAWRKPDGTVYRDPAFPAPGQ